MDLQLSELLEWAGKHGARDCSLGNAAKPTQRSCLGRSLVVASFPEAGGRGLGASRDLAAGKLVLTIPESLLMTARSAQADPILGPILARRPHLAPHQVLILHLLHEVSKGAASFWRPYLLSLPRAHHTLALFPPSQVPHLQVPDAMDAARHARSQAHRDWSAANAFLQALALPPKFRSFQAWLWAVATVTSRTVAVPFSSSGALCPVGDLFNYAAPSPKDNTMRLTDGAFDDDRNAFCFYAREAYAAGQQVLLCYGTYRNLELLEHYGFLLPANPNDAITIPLPTTLHSTHNHGEEAERRPECHVGADGRPSFALLAALRLRAASTAERKQRGHVASAGMQISVAGDIIACEWLHDTCQQLLLVLPTSCDFDLALRNTLQKPGLDCDHAKKPHLLDVEIDKRTDVNGLAKTTLDDFFLLALDWRIGYKELLISVVQYSARCVEELKAR